MKNKKADMNVMIMVFMTLVIFVSMLFIFIISQKQISKSLPSAEVIEGIYSEENLIRFYITDLAEKSLTGLDKNDPLFKQKFEDKFKQELDKNSNIKYINEIKNKEIEFLYNEENIKILVKDFQLREISASKTYKTIKILNLFPTPFKQEEIVQLLGIYYNTNITVSIPL